MKSTRLHWVWLGLLLLVGLPILTPFLHNHDADFEEHEDCPAHVVLLAFQALDLPDPLIAFLAVLVSLLFFAASFTHLFSDLISHRLRAPPLSL